MQRGLELKNGDTISILPGDDDLEESESWYGVFLGAGVLLPVSSKEVTRYLLSLTLTHRIFFPGICLCPMVLYQQCCCCTH